MTEEQAGIRKFMPADDVSDSDEEQMDESDSEADDSAVKTSSNDHGVEQIDDEGLEPPSKRRAMGLASHHDNDETNVPKWSNPDPYTVLPPVGEEAHKRKDVVKLIRKANQQIKFPAQSNQVAANDDFISFGFGDEEVSKCEEASPRPSSHHGEYYARGFPRAPLGPRQVESSRFSHLQNLHSAPSVDASKRDGGPFSNDSIGASAIPIENSSAVLGDFIIDTGLPDRRALKFEVNVGDVTEDAVPNGDEALGNRKRTHDDIIKNEKVRSQTKNLARRGATVNGSLLQEWLPDRVTDPTPWLRRTGTMTANAGFR